MNKIGYNQLSAPEKAVYSRFEKAFQSCSGTIDGGGIDRKVDMMKVLQTALGDHPEVIYFNRTQIKLASQPLFGGRQIRLTGVPSPAQIRQMNGELEAARERAMEAITLLNPMTAFDKLLCIYEYLQDHVSYDEKELADSCRLGISVNPLSHSAYGALVQGKGVCDGIASAFGLLAQRMGFACTTVSGEAAFRTQGMSDHAWNIVQIGGNFYHVDATWDVNHKEATGDYSYEYFCVDDDSVSRDHTWDIRTTPPCTHEDFSYYRRARCYANNLSQLEEIFARFARSRQSVVRAKIAPGIAIPAPEDQYLGQKLVDVAAGVGRRSSIQFIWNPNSRCFYAKFNS